ncbi:MAG: T9SS type A sorting domain-containing protein [Ignavibacteriae bacterium]|nr:T9SS type A sorting domain-containing protein [Ignavibacteriota bacterium]
MQKRKFLLFMISCSLLILADNPPEFGPRVSKGVVENNEIDEASGLVASFKNIGVLWTHNDSGNDNKIFALDTIGKNLGEFTLNNIENRDWEDIAIGPGPDAEKSYLYIGDIGDNEAQYTIKYIYRFEEPTISVGQTPANETINNVEKISFYYPDDPRDAETLMIDPATKDLYIVGKRDSKIRLYRLQYPQSTSINILAEKVTEFTLPNDPEEEKPFNYITAGDISVDGTEIILKSYRNIYYWKKDSDKSITETLLLNTPEILPFVNSIDETQSEAVCWKPYDDFGYYTLSEEKVNYNGITLDFPANLYYYKRTSIINSVKKNFLQNKFILEQNYPNPFNPTTEIKYQIPAIRGNDNANVQLTIYDIIGREVVTLLNQQQKPGKYAVKFDGSNYTSGIYYYRLTVGNFMESKKMLLLK